jgi:hypothetical protein
MGAYLEELFAHDTIIICTDFSHMDENLNYTTDPCEKYTKQLSISMNRKYKGDYMPQYVIVMNKAW